MHTTDPTIPAHHTNALSILVVEDDKVNGPMLQELLSHYVGEVSFVHLAKNLVEARKSTSLLVFDFILSDNRLPDGKGVDFLNEIYKNAPGTFRCLMSGDFQPTPQEKERHNFLRKPMPISEIAEVVEKAREHKAESAKHPRKPRH